jgi:hypothetical protein
MWNAWRERDMLKSFWWRKMNDRGHLEDLDFGGKMIEI